jgi:hypothetical protein
LVLQLLLLLFLLRHVVADHTPGGGTRHGVMAGNMACDSTDYRTLDATFRRGGLRYDQHCDDQDGCGQELPLRVHCP